MKICSNCGNKLTDTDKKCIICKTNAKSAIPIENENDKEKIDDIVASVRAKGNEQTKKKPKGCLPVIIGIIIIFVIASVLGGGDKDNSKKANAPQQTELEKALNGAIEVDYLKLHEDYMANAIAADATYKDKMLIITGNIDRIDREIAGQPYVTFAVDNFLNDVRITFKKSEEEKVAQFTKGQTIKIVGKCTGTLLSTTVALKDAMVIE